MEKMEYFVEIAIQGDQVLSFVNCTENRAVYEVIGFNDPKIILIDYRQRGVSAIHELLKTRDLRAFAPKFNSPGQISLQEEEDGTILVEVNEPKHSVPDKMLWIAIGISDSIPVYEYLFERINPIAEDEYAFIAIFEIPNAGEEQFSVPLALRSQI